MSGACRGRSGVLWPGGRAQGMERGVLGGPPSGRDCCRRCATLRRTPTTSAVAGCQPGAEWLSPKPSWK